MCIFFEYYMTLCPPLLYCSIVLLGADMTAGPGQAPPARPLPYPLLGARLVPGPQPQDPPRHCTTSHSSSKTWCLLSHTNSAQTSVPPSFAEKKNESCGQSGQTAGKMVKSRKFKFLSLIWNPAGCRRVAEGGQGTGSRVHRPGVEWGGSLPCSWPLAQAGHWPPVIRRHGTGRGQEGDI